jgi:TPR repeat protein
VCYLRGTGVAKDERQAVKWFRLAADQGDVIAQCNMGLCYHRGDGVEKDERKSVKWYRLAAKQTDTGATGALMSRFRM